MKTTIDLLKDVVTGKLKFASPSEVGSRRSICNACTAQRHKFCTVCGCFLPIKIRLNDSHCPMELW